MVKGSTDGPHTLIIIERKTARRRIDSSPVAHEPRVDLSATKPSLGGKK